MKVTAVASSLWLAMPLAGQQHPLEQYAGSYEVVESTIPAPSAEIVYRSIAEGRGIHSTWRHGSGDTFYEAHAVWGYDSERKRVEVFEVNTEGVVALHVGGFNDGNLLTLERFAGDGVTVLERRVFQWTYPDTLEMTLDVFAPGGTIHHRVTLARN